MIKPIDIVTLVTMVNTKVRKENKAKGKVETNQAKNQLIKQAKPKPSEFDAFNEE